MRRSADFSAASTARRHRYFTAIHVFAYAQRPRAGIQADGSRSLFDRFDDAVTAMRLPAYPVSFANRSRRAGLQFQAPESHASASGTTWSMSKDDGSLVTTPS